MFDGFWGKNVRECEHRRRLVCAQRAIGAPWDNTVQTQSCLPRHNAPNLEVDAHPVAEIVAGKFG